MVRWKDEVERMVFEKENKVSAKNGNEWDNSIENGPTMKISNMAGPKCYKREEDDYDMIVTLKPMEIRGFIMEVTYQ